MSSGGGWPAFVKRSVPVPGSRIPSTTVVMIASSEPSVSVKRLRRSAIVPVSSACMRIARSALRIWPIVDAASIPRPTTSPIAIAIRPLGSATASYQSPPTAVPFSPGS